MILPTQSLRCQWLGQDSRFSFPAVGGKARRGEELSPRQRRDEAGQSRNMGDAGADHMAIGRVTTGSETMGQSGAQHQSLRQGPQCPGLAQAHVNSL